MANVLVTGGHGFLGRYVCGELEARGHKVVAPTHQECDFTYANYNINGEVIDNIIHMAAKVGGIGANRTYPYDFFYDNLVMGTKLFNEAIRSKIKKFVTVGTICSYPKNTPIPFKEEDLWNGYPEETNAPYGLAKKMLLVQGQAARQQYGFNSIYLLQVNLYGPTDNFDLNTSHVIPAMIRKFTESKSEVVLWGDGSPTREFLYVEDAARGIVDAMEKYDKPEPVNLGSGMEISIKDLAEKIAKLTGFKGKIIWDKSMPNGQPRRRLDVSKAKKEFGFEATTDFDEGLKKTVAWYEQTKR